ncbi:MAG: ABC transporter permease [Ideonella sp.]|nr:ABC transporter permease [Ideonella sp.]MCC7455572.1 ABC transporter permease [Nitrospira sp.]
MSSLQAATGPAPPLPRARPDARWLLLPALAMLVVGFALPLGSFFVRVFVLDNEPRAMAGAFVDVLGSPVMLNAMAMTNGIALVVTLAVLIVGYPVAYFLTTDRGWRFTAVIFCIVVPYFTSVIVRTYSWMVLLGRNGVVNRALLETGLIEQPLPLMYNKPAIVLAMSYVLLPYMVLTLYAAMRAIDPSLMRAAASLGASGRFAFRHVFLPLSMHGVLAACLIVFILALGFFITPALMGGPADVMIAMLIERAAEVTLDWRLAAILSLVLLGATLLLYALYFRFADAKRLLAGV